MDKSVDLKTLREVQVTDLPWETMKSFEYNGSYDLLRVPDFEYPEYAWYIRRWQTSKGTWKWAMDDGGGGVQSGPFDHLIEVNTRIHYLLVALGYKDTNDPPRGT